MNDPIFLPTAILFGGAAVEIVLGGVLSRVAKGWFAVAFALAALVATCPLLPEVRKGQALEATLGTWDAGVALAYRVDGLSVLFMLMGTGIGEAILLYAVRHMEHEEQGVTRFYALVLVFIGGLQSLPRGPRRSSPGPHRRARRSRSALAESAGRSAPPSPSEGPCPGTSRRSAAPAT